MSIKDISRFQYKYILKNEDNSLVWENGLNRIADLRMKVEESPDNMWKVIEIFDEWQLFNVQIRLNYKHSQWVQS